MSAIKIISNPYKKEIKYQSWFADIEEWIDISTLNNANSKLMKNDLTKGFFPFQVKQIVDAIIEEYGVDNEILQVVFEGSADEFQELKDVCEDDRYTDRVCGLWLGFARFHKYLWGQFVSNVCGCCT